MKRMNVTLLAIIAISLFALSSVFAQSYDYETMKMEEYNALLAEWQQRLDAAKTCITDEDTKIADLKKEQEDVQAQIDATWDETFTLCESDKAGNDAYVQELNVLKADVSAFLNMSAEDIYGRMNELDGFQARLDALKANPLSLLTANESVISSIQNMINQAREKGKAVIPPSYTVMRGDCLWRIAGKSDIYNDSYAWMRIYTSNQDQIKDPNLIYVNQIFSIPRVVGPNEHLVAKGENLSMIAGYANVYGSPFKWQKLHEANKNFIEDPNLIFPYQLLKITR
jgi:nucleoid-associated protein YgaU